jgi:insertion element IS1 protein InsB
MSSTGELIDIERVTISSERGRWKSTQEGNSLAAYSTARPVLNGEDEETGRKGLRLVLTQHHHTGKVLAYVFGRRQDNVFLQLQQLLEPFGITKFYTDGWGAYERHLVAEQHQVGKEHTQKIESKHINLRTRIKRLVRRTLCFSKTERMHDLVIGLFINRYKFGRSV